MMRLSELYKPKEINSFRKEYNNDRFQWIYKAMAALKQYGFNYAGQGSFATVAINDNYPFALKLFREDAGYIKWLDFCKKNQNNPFIPKTRGKVIRVIKATQKNSRDIYAIRIEKLNNYFTERNETELNSLFLKYVYEARRNKKLGKIGSSGNKFVDDIVDEFTKNFKLLDLTYSNIMRRNNSQIVIIDPYFGIG